MSDESWHLIISPQRQLRLERIVTVAAWLATWALWSAGVPWLACAATIGLTWTTLRLLNPRNYGVWVRSGEIDLRGPISSRILPASKISKMVVVPWTARLEVFTGNAISSCHVGLAGWSRDTQKDVVTQLADWAEAEGIDAPVVAHGGYARAYEALLGPVLASISFPRKLLPRPGRTWLIATMIAVVHGSIGVALYFSA